MLEERITALTEALAQLTEVVRGFVSVQGTVPLDTKPEKPAAKPEKPAKAEKPAAKAKTEPEPTSEPEEQEEETLDEDALIEEITETVKAAIVGADDPDEVKAKWTAIRKRFKVEKIGDLRGKPLKLAEALQEAQNL